MTAQPGLGVTGNGVGVTTPIAHRLAQSGLIAKAGGTANLVRAGVFYDGTTNIVSGTAGMSYDVAAFTAALTRGAGQGTVLLANDGTVNIATTAAPGSNSRIDIVYVWQRDFAIDGTDSNPVIGVVQGSPAASPSAPSLAAFPGALELARITVPAGVTATNSGTTITQTAPFTAAAGARIPVRTSASLPASAPTRQLAVALDTGVEYEWNGSAWVTTVEDTGWITPTLSGGLTNEASNPLQYRKKNGVVFFRGRLSTGSISSGATIFTLPVGFRPDGSAGAVNVFYADSNGPTRINIPTNTGVITLLGAAAAGNFTIPFSFIAAV